MLEILTYLKYVPVPALRSSCTSSRKSEFLEAPFSNLIGTHSWSAVKLELYGLKFYTLHVLGKPCEFLGSEPKFAEPTARPDGAVRCTAAKLVSDPNNSFKPLFSAPSQP